MQHRPMFPQPLASGNRIPTINIRMTRMKSRTMVHMREMRDFMRYGRPAHEYRRTDKSPAIANIAIGRATSPPRTRITHCYTPQLQPVPDRLHFRFPIQGLATPVAPPAPNPHRTPP